eukprot:TRINITY_DN1037_c0_g1_i15.p2 TRINITY_DN1037_c0_g1~~TRINITY_DN1037_c0_g1_i15.p2  ORF type:complete len:457 (+),score=76.97 TRINITY_DN1037_c0_g1_i15:1812-3182(+)
MRNYLFNSLNCPENLCHYSCNQANLDPDVCQSKFDPSVCYSPCDANRIFVDGYCYCLHGTYDSGYTLQCRPCHYTCSAKAGEYESCSEYNTRGTCSTCDADYHRISEGTSPTIDCTCDQYYIDNGVDQMCEECMIHCIKCSYTDATKTQKQCDVYEDYWDCEPGFYFVYDEKYCEQCVMAISNCLACDNATYCTQCNGDLIFNENNMNCEEPVINDETQQQSNETISEETDQENQNNNNSNSNNYNDNNYSNNNNDSYNDNDDQSFNDNNQQITAKCKQKEENGICTKYENCEEQLFRAVKSTQCVATCQAYDSQTYGDSINKQCLKCQGCDFCLAPNDNTCIIIYAQFELFFKASSYCIIKINIQEDQFRAKAITLLQQNILEYFDIIAKIQGIKVNPIISAQSETNILVNVSEIMKSYEDTITIDFQVQRQKQKLNYMQTYENFQLIAAYAPIS